MALRIRCSALGKIMTNPRSGGGLSETTKAYIEELFLEYEYGIKKEFWSRYTDKGIAVEKDSIKLANEVLDWNLSDEYIEEGGQEYFRNDWVHGQTDVFTDWMLADVKSCWSGNTFPWFEEKLKSKDYFYQMQGYMWLTGHDTSTLAYCLVNTPEHMVLDEIRREHWKQNSYWNGDEDPQIVEFVRAQHEFNHIPKENRVRAYTIEKDEKVILDIQERIMIVRDYYEQLRESEKIRNKISDIG